jgi:hypothetical protein
MSNITAAAPPAPATPDPVTAAQAVAKIDATAVSNAVVAVNPAAVHHVKITGLNAQTGSSAAVGAGVGFLVGGPIGAPIGALIGWGVERYQVAGGPIGKAVAKVKAVAQKMRHGKAPMAHVPTPGVAAPASPAASAMVAAAAPTPPQTGLKA